MSDCTQRRFLDQVEQVATRLRTEPGLPFSELLSADVIQQALDSVGGAFRDRIFTPVVTLWMFLSQVLSPDQSCRDAVARFLAFRTSRGESPCSPNTGSYCTARGRLPVELLRQLTRSLGRKLHDQSPAEWHFHGRRVVAVDGTTVSMPDTPDNQREYPQPASQQPGLGFPIARMVVIFSLAVGTAIDMAIGPYKGKQTGETSLFRGIWDCLQEGDVVTGDRHYCTYADVALLQARRVDVVMRKHQLRHTDFRTGRRLGKHDHVVTWTKPTQRSAWMDEATYADLPEALVLREISVHVKQKGWRVKSLVVVTTLLDAEEFTRQEIGALYLARWNAELDLRSLKVTLKMDIVRGQSPSMVRKEIWARLLAYNAIRTTMAQAASCCEVLPRSISFTGALQTIRAFHNALDPRTPRSVENLAVVLVAIASHRVGDRPNRFEPRAIKRRPKPHDLLTEPRDAARKRCLQSA